LDGDPGKEEFEWKFSKSAKGWGIVFLPKVVKRDWNEGVEVGFMRSRAG
jgi:hypothetical protein